MFTQQPPLQTDVDKCVVEGLARDHGVALLRYFQRKGFGLPDAEDAVQEVFVRLARREGFAADVHHYEGYLFKMAAHVAIDLQRSARDHKARMHDSYEERTHARLDHSPDEVAEGREAFRIISTALKELPERTRIIFILARLEQMKQVEIAQRLSVSINTVEKHLAKAIAYLGERVGR